VLGISAGDNLFFVMYDSKIPLLCCALVGPCVLRRYACRHRQAEHLAISLLLFMLCSPLKVALSSQVVRPDRFTGNGFAGPAPIRLRSGCTAARKVYTTYKDRSLDKIGWLRQSLIPTRESGFRRVLYFDRRESRLQTHHTACGWLLCAACLRQSKNLKLLPALV
jgi:hypothetical protein